MRETITFTVKGLGEFEVCKTRTCRDDFKIEAVAAEMCGGGVELLKFKTQISNEYSKVESQAKKDVRGNLMDLAFFMDLNENINQIYSYAILQTMLVKTPATIPLDLAEWTKDQLKQIYSAYEVALKPFSGVKQPSSDEKTHHGVQRA